MKTCEKIFRALNKAEKLTQLLNGGDIKVIKQQINVSVNGSMQYLTLSVESKVTNHILGTNEVSSSVTLYYSKSRMSGTIYPNFDLALNEDCEHDLITQYIYDLKKEVDHTIEELKDCKTNYIEAMNHFAENFKI